MFFSIEYNRYIEVGAFAFFDYVRDIKCDSLTYSFNTVFFCVPQEDIPFAKWIKAFCVDVTKPFV